MQSIQILAQMHYVCNKIHDNIRFWSTQIKRQQVLYKYRALTLQFPEVIKMYFLPIIFTKQVMRILKLIRQKLSSSSDIKFQFSTRKCVPAKGENYQSELGVQGSINSIVFYGQGQIKCNECFQPKLLLDVKTFCKPVTVKREKVTQRETLLLCSARQANIKR